VTTRRGLISWRLVKEPGGLWAVHLPRDGGRPFEYRFPTRETAVTWLGYAIELAESLETERAC
jgi:hypothetical protein